MKAPPDWTPVLSGNRYCSPACGHGCTITEHDAAVKKAKALARLCGKGWKPRVWENMGWHYSAVRGTSESRAEMSRNERGGRFTCSVDHRFHATAGTTKAAIARTLKNIDESMHALRAYKKLLRR